MTAGTPEGDDDEDEEATEIERAVSDTYEAELRCGIRIDGGQDSSGGADE